MKSNDEILKYIAGIMTEKEKSDFEERAARSEELNNELRKYQNSMSELNALADIKEESPYFQNLLPRVRTRLDKEKKLKWSPKFAYLVTTATAILLIVINIGRFSPEKGQMKQEAAVENQVSVNKTAEVQNVQDLYKKYIDAWSTEIIETANKQSNVSFEVGVGDVAGKESIKEVVTSRISYPLEDYLVALR
jgi:anti-sigma-K factor RskA